MPNIAFIASKVPEIRGGSHNFKIGSRDPLVTPIDLIFHFFPLGPLRVERMPNFELLASTVPEIRGGPIFPKLGDVTPS